MQTEAGKRELISIVWEWSSVLATQDEEIKANNINKLNKYWRVAIIKLAFCFVFMAISASYRLLFI